MIGGINSKLTFTFWLTACWQAIVVDVKPWKPIGNYSHTVVEGNTIYGGFATSVSWASESLK